MCFAGNPGDEQHLVFECQALQGVTYNGRYGDHATVFNSCGNDTHAVAKFIKECMNKHGETAFRARHQIKSKRLEMMLKYLPPSLLCRAHYFRQVAVDSLPVQKQEWAAGYFLISTYPLEALQINPKRQRAD